MATQDMQRGLSPAQGGPRGRHHPWEWIVDETRELEQRRNLETTQQHSCARSARAYRRDFWNQQPERVEVWSEKGTVRGVLQPGAR